MQRPVAQREGLGYNPSTMRKKSLREKGSRKEERKEDKRKGRHSMGSTQAYWIWALGVGLSNLCLTSLPGDFSGQQSLISIANQAFLWSKRGGKLVSKSWVLIEQWSPELVVPGTLCHAPATRTGDRRVRSATRTPESLGCTEMTPKWSLQHELIGRKEGTVCG